MKYLLALLGIVLFAWHWRSARRRELQDRSAKQPPTTTTSVVEMVPCSYCGVHLPAAESFAGLRGTYCTEEHRRFAER
jgi:uncharacterized protein